MKIALNKDWKVYSQTTRLHYQFIANEFLDVPTDVVDHLLRYYAEDVIPFESELKKKGSEDEEKKLSKKDNEVSEEKDKKSFPKNGTSLEGVKKRERKR